MKSTIVYIVGHNQHVGTQVVWTTQGVFSNFEQAFLACTSPFHCLIPLELDQLLADDYQLMEGIDYVCPFGLLAVPDEFARRWLVS